MFKVFNT